MSSKEQRIGIKKFPVPSAMLVDPRFRTYKEKHEVGVYQRHRQRLEPVVLNQDGVTFIEQETSDAVFQVPYDEREIGSLFTPFGIYRDPHSRSRFLIGTVEGFWNTTADQFNLTKIEIVDYRESAEDVVTLVGQIPHVYPGKPIIASTRVRAKVPGLDEAIVAARNFTPEE